MTWILSEKEIASVLAADGRRRYEYFIHRVCETKKVWMLYADGWATIGEAGKQLIPLWPHQRYAELFCVGEWSAYAPQAVELHEFLDHWMTRMKRDEIEPAVLPGAAGSAVVVSLDDLEANLRHELAECYGEAD